MNKEMHALLLSTSQKDPKIIEEYLNNQPKDIYDELDIYVDQKARNRVTSFCLKIIDCAISYAADAVDASSANLVLEMDDTELLEDFNNAFEALHIEGELNNDT